MKRERRSAIVVVSSSAAIGPLPGFTTYCATKTFASFIARGLSFELKEKCDVLAWQPAGIKTKLADEFMDKEPEVGGGIISCNTAVNDMFKQLGRESVAVGNWRHASSNSIIGLLPGWFINRMVFKMMSDFAENKAKKT